jgi:hypothetical protein
MFELQAGMTFDGVDYTAKYIEGGAFSLDGVHPTQEVMQLLQISL